MFKNIAIATLALTLTLGSCKYEERPNISLRTKRDRVANEWVFDAYTYNGVDALNEINGDTFKLVLNMYRTNDYGSAIIKPLANGGYETSHTGNVTKKWNSNDVIAYSNNLPDHVKAILPGGYWNFDKRHYKLQIKPELSYDPDNQGQVLSHEGTIIKLKEKEMKIEGRDKNDIPFTFTLKPLNDEPYFF
jgi:hypothetical protein